MSDTVASLPAEYRTPSLESLPLGLQQLVVRNIRSRYELVEGGSYFIKASARVSIRIWDQEVKYDAWGYPYRRSYERTEIIQVHQTALVSIPINSSKKEYTATIETAKHSMRNQIKTRGNIVGKISYEVKKNG